MSKRSIIAELDDIESTNHDLFVESKANNAIVAAINVIKLLEDYYSVEDAEELTRRLINSIRGQDPNKFKRKIRQISEDKKK